MNITIKYHTSQWVEQSGVFKYGKAEDNALRFWKQIKRETHNAKLGLVLVDGSKDITEAVKALDNVLPPDNLPF